MNIKNATIRAWVGGMVLTGVTYGFYLTFSNYFIPFSERTGISVPAISIMYSFLALSTFLTSLVFGNILNKVRVKILVPIGSILFALLPLAMGFAPNTGVLYAVAFLAGIGQVFIGFPMGQALIVWWTDPKKIGFRLNTLTTSLAIVSFVANPIVAKSIIAIGAGPTAAIQAALVVIFIGVVGGILIKERPDRYGITLDFSGGAKAATENVDPAKAMAITPVKFVLKTYPFWLLAVCALIEAMTFSGYASNASPFYQSFGIDPVKAAFCISIVSGIQAIIAPLFGIAVDKIGLRKGVIIFAGIAAVAFFCSRFINGFSTAIIFAFAAGFYCFQNFIATVGFTKVYPNADLSKLIGYANAFNQIGTTLATPVAAVFLLRSGTYLSFMTFASFMLVVCIILTCVSTGTFAVNHVLKRISQ